MLFRPLHRQTRPADANRAASSSGQSSGGEPCAKCHRPIRQRGREGECLRCLLRFALLAEGDPWIGFPLEDDPPPAKTRYGHFELVTGLDGLPVELGSGATATTYRARDTVLATTVALKVIDKTVAGHPTARARFLREARVAAGLSHPNVAAVFFYGEQDGECFYAMELIEGGPLQARVRREGPFSVGSALDLGTQIASALEAAEACGVVHRDLKPSNLMIVARPDAATPVVKVIDWGLAKAVSAGPFLGAEHTRDGFVGTPAYASPEQFARAGDRRIDTCSDIYSLGVTLWFLLCGRTPFAGDNLDEIHAQQTGQPLPVGQLTAAGVPAPMVELLQAMLTADPGARLQSARELSGALARCRQRLAARPRRVRRLAGAAVAAGLLLGLSARAWVPFRSSPPPAFPLLPPRTVSIAVLPFEDLDADPADALLVQGVGQRITDKLARVAALKLVRPLNPPAQRPRPDNLAEIGEQLGVGYVFRGSLSRAGDHLTLRVRLCSTGNPSGPPVWQAVYQRPLAQVLATETEAARAVLARLGVTPTPAEQTLLDRAPTTDLEAYGLYLRVVTGPALLAGPAEVRQTLRGQIALLEAALARDPNFVPAYCALASSHDQFGPARPEDSPAERAVDHRALAEAALQKARLLSPDEGLVHWALAFHFHTVNHDDEQARVEAELARRTLPNDPYVHHLLGNLARTAGRWDEALGELREATTLSPDDATAFLDLTNTYRALRRYDEATQACAKCLAVTTGSKEVGRCLVQAIIPLEQSADLTSLRTALAAADRSLETSASASYEESRLVLAFLARDPDGISRVLAADKQPQFGMNGFPYPADWFAAQAARMRGDASAARAALTSAREAAARAAQINPSDPARTSVLAMIDAQLGRGEDAVHEGRLACEMMPAARSATLASALACHRAIIYACLDQPEAAFALLDQLAGQAAGRDWWYRVTYGDLVLNPLWDPLRKDARFPALLARLAPRSL